MKLNKDDFSFCGMIQKTVNGKARIIIGASPEDIRLQSLIDLDK